MESSNILIESTDSMIMLNNSMVIAVTIICREGGVWDETYYVHK